jgi:hypothetical protein
MVEWDAESTLVASNRLEGKGCERGTDVQHNHLGLDGMDWY